MTKIFPIADAARQISGVPVTAYRSDGSVDYAQSADIAARIGKAGVRNVIAAGNTGEYFSLTHDEIRRLQSAVIEATAPHALVTASVGRSLTEACQLADAAVADGAGAIMGHYPNDPFAGPSQKIDYFLRLADHIGVPVVAYLRSDEAAIADLIRLAAHDNVAAVKFAAPNPVKLAEAIRETSDHDTVWVCGLAEGWAPPFYAVGARGFTSGLVNVFPEISLAIWAALEAGDFASARAQIDRIVAFEDMRTLYNNGANVTVVKEALALLGHRVGPVRLPGVERLNTQEHARLRQIVSAVRGKAIEQETAQ